MLIVRWWRSGSDGRSFGDGCGLRSTEVLPDSVLERCTEQPLQLGTCLSQKFVQVGINCSNLGQVQEMRWDLPYQRHFGGSIQNSNKCPNYWYQ